MGYMKHNAVVVTNWDEKELKAAHQKAKEVFADAKFNFKNGERLVSEIVYGIVNSQCSFFIAPDGSKEGWGDSTNGDEARKEFQDWLLKNENFSDYIEVRFGGDDEYDTVIRSKDTDLNELSENSR